MTIYEASLRNLVREEATTAALRAIEAMPTDRQAWAENQQTVLEAIGEAARAEFARIRTASAYVAREEAQLARHASCPAQLKDEQLAQYRKAAIELAVEAGARGDDVIPLAEKCARFIIDGVLVGSTVEAQR